MAASRHDATKATAPESEPIHDRDSADPPAAPTDRLAVVSLVAGIAGFFLPIVGPVTAVVAGHVARDEIRKAGGKIGGDSLARTGMILGYVWIGLTVLVLAFMAEATNVELAEEGERGVEEVEPAPPIPVRKSRKMPMVVPIDRSSAGGQPGQDDQAEPPATEGVEIRWIDTVGPPAVWGIPSSDSASAHNRGRASSASASAPEPPSSRELN